MHENQNNDPARYQQSAVLTPEEQEKINQDIENKKEMMAFCYLDSFDDQTQFIDIRYNYNEGKTGRTVVVLGALGLHARLKGRYTAMFNDPKMNLEMPKDYDFDVCVSVCRADVTSVTIHKVKPPEDAPNQKTTWNVVVAFSTGVVTLQGLEKQGAINFKKQIWNWRTFNNYTQMQKVQE